MAKEHNVIIIGAGSAGLTAAWKAAEKGLKVVVIEKKNDICKVVRTTGNAFRNRTLMNGEFLTVEKQEGRANIHFQNSDFDLEYTGALIDTYDAYSFSNGGYCMRKTRNDRPSTCVFSVKDLYNDLKGKAEEAGASFLTGTLALIAEKTDQGVRVQIKKGGKLSWLEADLAIAADGLNSRLVEAMGLNKDRTFYVKGPCFETTFEDVAFPYPVGTSSFRGKTTTAGIDAHVFLYPSAEGKNAFSVMVQTKMPANQGPKVIKHLTTQSIFAPWFKNAKPLSPTAAMVTLRSALVTPYADRTLFIGDASAYGETLVTGAIRCGYHAADAVYKEISGQKGFAEYQDFWVSNFDYVKNPKKQADYTRILLLYGYLTEDELDLLYKLSQEKGPIQESGDTPSATEYTGAHQMIDYFMSFPEVKGDLRKKLQEVKDADMQKTSNLRKWKN
jgi:flavin-dependent dehydrogenase